LKLNVIEPFFSFSNMNEWAVQFNIRFSQGSAATYFRCLVDLLPFLSALYLEMRQ